MRLRNALALILAASGLLVLSSCGGGGGSGSNVAPAPPSPPNAAVGGAWLGQLGSGEELIGLVAESGEFHFLDANGVQYFGTVTSNVNAISAQLTGYALLGTTFLDNSTTGTGTLTGTIAARSTMTANATFRTSAGTQSTNTITLTYDALYDRDSSLATVAGNFTDLATGAIVNINANGITFMQDPITGCVINGTVSIINSQFNVYRVQYTHSGCQVQFAVLNGVTLRGLAILDNTVSPEALIAIVQGQAGNIGISFLNLWERT